MFITPYLYATDNNPTSAKKVVIVLPEIFGLTRSIREVADRFAEEFHVPSFALDFFYALDEKPHDLDYATGLSEGIELMQDMTGELFLELFDKAVVEIKKTYPEVEEYIVCGFCFGGKLAYLSGARAEVSHIISFYGARSTLPFIDDTSVLEYTVSHRPADTPLRVLGLFGSTDESIVEEDRKEIKELFSSAGIKYTSCEFPTGHAFFNVDRPTFHKKSAEEAWTVIKNFLL